MKTLLHSLLLGVVFITPAFADTNTDDPVEKEKGVNIEISVDDNGDNDAITEKELETKIKGKVFSIIGDIIDAADDELTDEEKEDIKSDVKEAIAEIKEARESMDEDEHNIVIDTDGSGIFDDGISLIEALIPITAIVFTFGMPIMIVAVVLYSSYRKKRLMHETIDAYVHSGKDIPPEVLKGLQKEITPKNNLHRGLVMSGIGLGIFACFAVIGSLEAAAFGLIPLFIGLAQLLIWKMENR